MNTMLSSEVWQDIQGYSGIYQVSTLGRIRSLKKGKIKLLKPYINNMGYAVLSLYANHKQKTYHVHKLVAETFLVKVDGKNYIATYATLTDAQTITGIAYQNIRACCIGRYKTAGNYIWKFNK